MQVVYAIFLGVVQGLTEFLPVSSSGHLALVGKYFDIGQPGIIFEVFLHVGTLLAVVWHLREKILRLTRKDILLVILGSIPVGVVGILFGSIVEGTFSIIKLTGFAFLISAFLNYQTDKSVGSREALDKYDAIVIGIMQAVAVIPGISRSGATIFAGSKMNLAKTSAAEFSFLLSIPAILGANLYEFLKHSDSESFSLGLALIGFAAAFFSGIIAINVLMNVLVRKKLRFFSYYLIFLGIVTILFL